MANSRAIPFPRSKEASKKSLLVSSSTNFKVPQKTKSWGVGILVSAIVVVLPAKYVVIPLHNHYIAQQQAILAQDASVLMKINEGTIAKSRFSYYTQEKSKIDAALPAQFKQEAVISTISQVAQKDNVTLSTLQVISSSVSVTANFGVSNSSGAVARQLSILGDGNYSDITNFIHDLQAEPQLYQVYKAQVSQYQGANSPNGGANTSSNTYKGYDTVALTVIVYSAN